MSDYFPCPRQTSMYLDYSDPVYMRLHVYLCSFPYRAIHSFTKEVSNFILSFDPSMPLDPRICRKYWREELWEHVSIHGYGSERDFLGVFEGLGYTEDNWINQLVGEYKRFRHVWKIIGRGARWSKMIKIWG